MLPELNNTQGVERGLTDIALALKSPFPLKLFTGSVTTQTGAWTLFDYSAAGFTSTPKIFGNYNSIPISPAIAGWIEFGSIGLTSCLVLCRQSATVNVAATVSIMAVGS